MLVAVYEADTSIDAHVLRGLLEQHEIPVHIVGEALEGGVGDLPAGGLIALLVPEESAADARAVVEAYESNRHTDALPTDAGASARPPAPGRLEIGGSPDARAGSTERIAGVLLLIGALIALAAIAVAA